MKIDAGGGKGNALIWISTSRAERKSFRLIPGQGRGSTTLNFHLSELIREELDASAGLSDKNEKERQMILMTDKFDS